MKFDRPRFPSDNLHRHSHLRHDLMELVRGPHQHLLSRSHPVKSSFSWSSIAKIGGMQLQRRLIWIPVTHQKKKKKTINLLFNLWINPMNPGSSAGACWGKWLTLPSISGYNWKCPWAKLSILNYSTGGAQRPCRRKAAALSGSWAFNNK